MMLHCKDRILPEQIALLQTYKDNAGGFDSTQAEYAALLNFDLSRFEVDPSLTPEQQQGPIELTKQEAMMQTIVEVKCYLSFLYLLIPLIRR
jgi:hypothetical protein